MAIVEELEDSPGLDYDAERQQQGDPLVSLSELLKSCPSLDGLNARKVESLNSVLPGDAASTEALPDELQSMIYETLQQSCRLLEPLQTFILEEWDLNPEDVKRMTYWRTNAESLMNALDRIIRWQPDLAALLLPDLFTALTRFRLPQSVPKDALDLDRWTNPLLSSLANNVLQRLEIDYQTISELLNGYIRSCFAGQRHAHVNSDTGRKLHHPLGTTDRHLDRHNDVSTSQQKWKGHEYQPGIGCWNVFVACLEKVKAEEVESQWHLMIPPLMTLLDDADPPFRIRGLVALQALLPKVDPGFLRRSGVAELAQKSLSTSLTYLSNSHYLSLVSLAFDTSFLLIDHQHPPTPEGLSEARFDTLSDLMKQGPLQITLFASDKPKFMTLAAQEVSRLAPSLGIMSGRFLQDIMHPMLALLSFPAVQDASCISAICHALVAVLQETQSCRPAHRWRGAVLSALCKCYIQQRDQNGVISSNVGQELQRLLQELVKWDAATKDDVAKLQSLNDTSLNKLLEVCA